MEMRLSYSFLLLDIFQCNIYTLHIHLLIHLKTGACKTGSSIYLSLSEMIPAIILITEQGLLMYDERRLCICQKFTGARRSRAA